jgi:hypothetical protein
VVVKRSHVFRIITGVETGAPLLLSLSREGVFSCCEKNDIGSRKRVFTQRPCLRD